MEFKLDNSKIPNGVVLVLGITYEGQTTQKVWEYAFLKAGGLWYGTGNGKVPTAAGWPAINRWLAKDGRKVIRAEVLAERIQIFPERDPVVQVATSQS